jgi:hypothetical protein
MKDTMIKFRISSEVKDNWSHHASVLGLSVSQLIIDSVESYISGVPTSNKVVLKAQKDIEPTAVPTNIDNVTGISSESVPTGDIGLLLDFCNRDFDMQFDAEDIRKLELEAKEIAKSVGCLVNFRGRYFYRMEGGVFNKIGSW